MTTYLLLLTGMLFFGAGTPLSKLIGQDVPIYIAAFLRMLIAAVTLSPYLIYKHNTIRKIPKNDYGLLAVITLVGMGLFTITLLEGTQRISGVLSSIIMSLVPAVTGIGSVLVFKEKFSNYTLLSLALAVTGVVIINVSSSDGPLIMNTRQSLIGALLVLAAVVSEASYSLAGKKISADLNPVITTGLAAWGGTLLFLPIAAYQFFQNSSVQISLENWAALFGWSLGTLCIGTVLWYQGMKRARAVTASVFMAVMPVSALIFSYILLGEAFQWVHVLGFGIVVSGILLGTRKNAKEANE